MEVTRFTEGVVKELRRLHELCQVEKDAKDSKTIIRCREEMVDHFERVLDIALLAVKMSDQIQDLRARTRVALSGEVVEVLPTASDSLESLRLRAGLEAILDFVGRTAPRGSGQDVLTTERLSWERKVRGLAKKALKEVRR